MKDLDNGLGSQQGIALVCAGGLQTIPRKALRTFGVCHTRLRLTAVRLPACLRLAAAISTRVLDEVSATEVGVGTGRLQAAGSRCD